MATLRVMGYCRQFPASACTNVPLPWFGMACATTPWLWGGGNQRPLREPRAVANSVVPRTTLPTACAEALVLHRRRASVGGCRSSSAATAQTENPRHPLAWRMRRQVTLVAFSVRWTGLRQHQALAVPQYLPTHPVFEGDEMSRRSTALCCGHHHIAVMLALAGTPTSTA